MPSATAPGARVRLPSSVPDVCVRLSGVSYRVFPERTQSAFGVDAQHTRAVARYAGREAEAERFQRLDGNSFITMGEALLADLPGPLPEQDVVLLAYHAPDLFVNEVAGCYLAERIGGAPVPCSVAGQGPGGVFTALRIADGMCKLGELDRGVLFGYDQNAVLWDPRHPASALPDAAVLLRFGRRGDVAVACLEEVPVGVSSGTPGPGAAEVFRAARQQSPGADAVVGHGLWAELNGRPAPDVSVPGASVPGVAPATGLWSTGVWAYLARHWPITRPLLVADYDPAGQRVYLALLMPEALLPETLPAEAPSAEALLAEALLAKGVR